MQKASLTEADHERCSTHRDPDENNFNGPSYITRLSYSLFRSSLALDRCLEKRTRGGVNANLRRREKEKEKEEEVEKVEEEKEKNEARKEREREKKREERERDAHEGAFCFVGPGKHRTGSGVSAAVAMPFTRGGRTALTVFPLRELLGGPHGGVWLASAPCSSLLLSSSRMEGCRNTNGKSMAADHSRGFKDSG